MIMQADLRSLRAVKCIQGFAGETKASRFDGMQLFDNLEQKFVGKMNDVASSIVICRGRISM